MLHLNPDPDQFGGGPTQFQTRVERFPFISCVKVDQLKWKAVCPEKAIGANPDRIDMLKCVYCMRCAEAFPDKVSFAEKGPIASNVLDRFVILQGDGDILFDDRSIRPALKSLSEQQLRYFVMGLLSAPIKSDCMVMNSQEANAIIITEPVSKIGISRFRANYALLRGPKLLVVAGSEAILDFHAVCQRMTPDLLVSGHPVRFEDVILSTKELLSNKKNQS